MDSDLQLLTELLFYTSFKKWGSIRGNSLSIRKDGVQSLTSLIGIKKSMILTFNSTTYSYLPWITLLLVFYAFIFGIFARFKVVVAIIMVVAAAACLLCFSDNNDSESLLCLALLRKNWSCCIQTWWCRQNSWRLDHHSISNFSYQFINL